MSANNIVVIVKEEADEFVAYHRDMDAYCKGQYYDCPEEEPIFVAASYEDAIREYSKWLEELNEGMFPFVVEYGYTFEGV